MTKGEKVLQINQDLCTGCGLCVDMCAFGALTLKDNKAVVDNSACSLCGACVNVCAQGAILLADDQQIAHQNISDYRSCGSAGKTFLPASSFSGGRRMGGGKGNGNGMGGGFCGGMRGGRRGGGGRRSS